MHILGFVAENYKRLRVVQITPTGRLVQITGKNGQGKTSVLDAIWAAFVGAKAIPEKPVRKGAERARIKLNLGEFIVTRTIAPAGTHTLTVENAKGVKIASPQSILDELLGSLSFDPLAFVGMKPKEQVDMLRQTAKIDLDTDALNEENEKDFQERRIINREVDRLRAELSSITVQAGLPKEKVDESAIMQQLSHAAAKNRDIQQQFRHKQELKDALDHADRDVIDNAEHISKGEKLREDLREQIRQLELQIDKVNEALNVRNEKHKELFAAGKAALDEYEKFPVAEVIDTAEITAQLQQAQLVNREIDKRTKSETTHAALVEQQNESDRLTRAIEDRNEKKAAAVQNAQMPVEGLTFDDNEVSYHGIPLDQLGEAEQLRISVSIAMAANPKLRVIRIMHGEALDEDSLRIIAKMAEDHDYQIWMARVDSSGKCGIVMEDGMIKQENAE